MRPGPSIQKWLSPPIEVQVRAGQREAAALEVGRLAERRGPCRRGGWRRGPSASCRSSKRAAAPARAVWVSAKRTRSTTVSSERSAFFLVRGEQHLGAQEAAGDFHVSAAAQAMRRRRFRPGRAGGRRRTQLRRAAAGESPASARATRRRHSA